MSDISIDHSQPFRAKTLRLFAAVGAGALIAFGVLCWIAANWPGFHRLTKLELAGGLLVGASLIAALAPRARIAALLVATAAVGGLLALIGQIYPSGADAWQLFALWAALALPFALAARHDAVWSLWSLVAIAGVGLWRVQAHDGDAFADWGPACAIGAALAALLSPYLPLRRLIGRSVWAFRLAGLSVIGHVAVAGLMNLVDHNIPMDAGAFAATGILIAAAGALAALSPLESGLLAIAVLAIDMLIVVRIGKAVMPDRLDMAPMFLIAVVATAVVAASVALLREIMRRRAPQATDGKQDAAPSSWPLAALSGFGALIAAVPFLVFYGLLFDTFLDKPPGAAMVGGATLAAALAVLRGGSPYGFRQMFGMIAALVGLALITYSAERAFSADAGFVLCLAAAASAWAVPARGARSVFGFIAAAALFVSIFARATIQHVEIGLALASCAAAVAALAMAAPALSRHQNGAAIVSRARPFLAGWTVASLCALILLAGRPFLADGGYRLFGELVGLFHAPWSGPAQFASVAFGLAGAGLALGNRADLRTPAGFGVAAVAAALTFWCPTLGATIFILACALLVPSRALVIAAALGAIWIVSALYYSLALPLAQKGYGLMALGGALGAMLAATRERADQAEAPAQAVGLASAALILLGLASTGALATSAVSRSEAVLRNGRQIYIALRPVDPRSLVQGDYMAVAFDTSGLPSGFDGDGALAGRHLAVVELDGRSVARFVALDAAPQANQIAVQVRVKSRRWFVGTDAYFFEEGRAKDFVGARYGGFRVGADGRLLLVALADKDLRVLP